jgi:uncharacterized Zn-binding protein involved in type VI secretion
VRDSYGGFNELPHWGSGNDTFRCHSANIHQETTIQLSET